MKRYVLFCLFLGLSVIAALGLAFAIHAIVFHALEPKALTYPQDLEALRIFAAHQVQMGRLEAVDPLKQSYDISFTAESGQVVYYRLLAVNERYFAGLSRLFSQADFGRIDSEFATPVAPLLLTTLRWDLIAILPAALAGTCSLFITLIKKNPVIYRIVAFGLMGACLVYALLGIFLIHEPYSYLVCGVLAFAIPISMALSQRFGFRWWQILMLAFLSIAVAVILLILFSYKGDNLRLWMYSQSYYSSKDSWAAAYGYGFETLLFFLPLGVGLSFFAFSKNNKPD